MIQEPLQRGRPGPAAASPYWATGERGYIKLQCGRPGAAAAKTQITAANLKIALLQRGRPGAAAAKGSLNIVSPAWANEGVCDAGPQGVMKVGCVEHA